MGTWGSIGIGPGLLSAAALASLASACSSENPTDGLSGSGGSAGGPTNAAGTLANPQQSSSVACAEAVGDWCRVLVTETSFASPQFLVGVDHAGDVVSVGQAGPSDSRMSQVQVAKYTPDGALLWRREFGGRNFEVPHAFAIDANDDIFVVGIDGDALGRSYPFIWKMSAHGETLWMQLVAGDAQEAFGVAVDASGNAVAVLDNGAVVKYSARGEPLWAHMTADKTRALDVVVDAAGDCFVLQRDAEGGFLTKLTAAGELLWERNLGQRWVFDVALDPSGGLWTLDTGRDLDSRNLMSRYSAEGALLWSRDGVPEQSMLQSLAFDASGNVFILGPTTGHHGAYLAQYAPDGTPLWGQDLGLRGGGRNRDLAVAPNGAVFVTGDYPDAPTGAFIVRVTPPE